MTEKKFTDKKRTIGFATKITWQNISRMYDIQAEQYNLSISAAFVLLHLEEKGTAVNQIANEIGMEPSSMTRLLNNIEKKGLVERKRENKQDRRLVMIYLTEKGSYAKAVAKHKVKHFNKKIQELIKPKKLETFFEVLEQVNALMDSNQIFDDEPEFKYNPYF